MAKFADVLTIINGRNQSKVENPNGLYPIYGSGGIMGYADEYLCEADTVVIGRKGSINKPIYVNTPFWNVDTAFGLAAKRDVLLPKYLYYFCVHFDFEKLNTTVTIPSLTKSNLLEIDITLPTLEEQHTIVEQLDKVENIISLRKQQIAKLDELVKARFVEMFENDSYEQVTVSSVLATSFWLMPATPEFIPEGEIPYITSKNIKNRKIDFVNVKYISKEAYASISANRPTQKGDILVSMIGTLGQTAVIQDDRAFYGQNLYLLRLDSTIINTTFFCEFINSDVAQHELQSKRNQSTQAYLKANHVEDLLLPLPPMEAQKSFAAFVAQTDQQKLTIQHSLDKMETLKKALMQKYFG